MVLKVPANTRRMNFHTQAVLLQLFGVTDTGVHERMGRPKRAQAKDHLLCRTHLHHFTTLVNIFHSNRPRCPCHGKANSSKGR